MNVLWPVFHDPSYRPSLAERLDFHWKANLRMLRQPRDIVLFSLISFAPLLLLVSFMRLFPDLFRAVSTEDAILLIYLGDREIAAYRRSVGDDDY